MDTEKEWVFDIKDYEGTSVVLNWLTWKSKAGNNGEGIHPESGIKGIRDVATFVTLCTKKM